MGPREKHHSNVLRSAVGQPHRRRAQLASSRAAACAPDISNIPIAAVPRDEWIAKNAEVMEIKHALVKQPRCMQTIEQRGNEMKRRTEKKV